MKSRVTEAKPGNGDGVGGHAAMLVGGPEAEETRGSRLGGRRGKGIPLWLGCSPVGGRVDGAERAGKEHPGLKGSL